MSSVSISQVLTGVVMLIEMLYHLTLESANGTTMMLFGRMVDTALPAQWAICVAVMLVGVIAFLFARTPFALCWGEVNAEIEQLALRSSK